MAADRADSSAPPLALKKNYQHWRQVFMAVGKGDSKVASDQRNSGVGCILYNGLPPVIVSTLERTRVC